MKINWRTIVFSKLIKYLFWTVFSPLRILFLLIRWMKTINRFQCSEYCSFPITQTVAFLCATQFHSSLPPLNHANFEKKLTLFLFKTMPKRKYTHIHRHIRIGWLASLCVCVLVVSVADMRCWSRLLPPRCCRCYACVCASARAFSPSIVCVDRCLCVVLTEILYSVCSMKAGDGELASMLGLTSYLSGWISNGLLQIPLSPNSSWEGEIVELSFFSIFDLVSSCYNWIRFGISSVWPIDWSNLDLPSKGLTDAAVVHSIRSYRRM